MINFFISRPVFSWVLAIVAMLAGIMAIFVLPVQRYPSVAPPAVEIQADYPGASADTVSNTVVQVIEQEMTGLDNLLYMGSTADSSGHATVTLTFAAGTDPDIAQVQVQNKLKLAEPRLPEVVRQQGISVEKSSTSFLMVMAFVSTPPLRRAPIRTLPRSRCRTSSNWRSRDSRKWCASRGSALRNPAPAF